MTLNISKEKRELVEVFILKVFFEQSVWRIQKVNTFHLLILMWLKKLAQINIKF